MPSRLDTLLGHPAQLRTALSRGPRLDTLLGHPAQLRTALFIGPRLVTLLGHPAQLRTALFIGPCFWSRPSHLVTTLAFGHSPRI